MSGGLICVAPGDVPQVWPLVEHMIDAAYAEFDELTPDVRTWLIEEKGLLWVYAVEEKIVAALTTSLVPMRRGLALRAVACGGGGLDLWRHHHAQLEKYALAEGCDRIRMDGREAWRRVLPGYGVRRVSLEKGL